MQSPDDSLPRVLHFRSSIGFYGAENVIYNLARTYRGPMMTVCLSDAREPHTELCDRLKAEGYNAATIASSGAFDPGTIRRLIRIGRAFRPDILHVHEYKTTIIGWLAARWLRVPVVSTLHGFVGGTASVRRYEALEARILPRLAGIAAVSRNTAERAREMGVPGDRLTIIPNGIDLQRFQPADRHAPARRSLGLAESGFLVALVGRLSEEKGHEYVISAVAGLADAGIDAQAVFAGDGHLRETLVEKALTAGVAGRVHMPGNIADAAVVYHASDVVVLPSFKEGLPLTVLEAGACARPVIATDVGEISRIIVDKKTGIVIPAGDAKALADALAYLAAKPEERESMGRAARKRIEKHYSAHAMASAYTDLYCRLSKRRNPVS